MMNRENFELIKIPEPWSKILVVTGLPGNRGDLLVGWLSNNLCDRFISAEWFIDAVWGKNYIPNIWAWNSLNKDSDIKFLLNDIFDEQHRLGAKWAVTKSHFTSDILIKLIPEELSQHFVILDLLVSDAESMAQVRWESFTKNYLRRLSSRCSQVFKDGERILRVYFDNKLHHMSNLDLLTMMYEDMHRRIANKNLSVNQNFNTAFLGDAGAKILPLQYADIMTNKGPQILADALEINLNPAGWDLPLAMSRCRDSYFCLGRWWHRPIP